MESEVLFEKERKKAFSKKKRGAFDFGGEIEETKNLGIFGPSLPTVMLKGSV